MTAVPQTATEIGEAFRGTFVVPEVCAACDTIIELEDDATYAGLPGATTPYHTACFVDDDIDGGA
jgi:hypothetical protein